MEVCLFTLDGQELAASIPAMRTNPPLIVWHRPGGGGVPRYFLLRPDRSGHQETPATVAESGESFPKR